jgi:hypothetical protein
MNLILAMRLIANESIPESHIMDLAPIIERESRRARLDPILVASVAWHESRWNQDARGKDGEIGVMQIHPRGAATFLCRSMPATTEGNVRCGIAILARARRMCGGPMARWLGAYAGLACGPSRYAQQVISTLSRGSQGDKP